MPPANAKQKAIGRKYVCGFSCPNITAPQITNAEILIIPKISLPLNPFTKKLDSNVVYNIF